MSGGNDKDVPRPAETRPKKYYWPWECTYSRFRFSLIALMLFVTAAAFGSCCLGIAFRSAEGTSLSAAEANRRLSYVNPVCRVPDGATDVALRASYFNVIVSFEMPFSEFSTYCVARGWYLRRIDPTLPVTVYDVDFKARTITTGYYYQGSTHRGGYDAYYDLASGRAWIHYSHH